MLAVDKRAATAKHFSHCEVLYWPIARKRPPKKSTSLSQFEHRDLEA